MELVKIAYHFADGHVEEMEVEPEIAEALRELDRQEYNSTQRETRRHVTFDASEELSWLAVEDQRLVRLLSGETDEQMLYAAIRNLNPKQQELIRSLFFNRQTQAQYGISHGITQQAVSDQLTTVIKKLKKLL